MDISIRKALQYCACGLALACAACNHGGADRHAAETGRPAEPAQTAPDTDKAPPIDTSLSDQVAGAISDLVSRAGVSPDAITVVQARSVTWGSSALGCPEYGMNYTQAVVPGVLVLLDANGTQYRYHGRAGRKLGYCPDDRAEAPAYGPGKEFM